MRPEARVLRRERRRAWKGIPTGRRATRVVQTTRGRHQKAREWDALIAVVFAGRKQETS